MTIADIFDRSVFVLVRRWQIAVIGTLVPALIDTAGRAATHSASLWFALTVARIGIIAYFLSAQVREFAAEANDPPAIRLAPKRAGSYARSLGALLFNVALGFVLICSLVIAGAAAYPTSLVVFIGISLVAIALSPLVLLICSTTYAIVILESLSTMKAFALARRRVFEDVLRSWLLGAAMAVVVVGWYGLVEALVRLIGAAFGPAWFVDTIPLFEIPATAFGTVLSTVVAIDYLARSNARSAM